MSNIKRYDIDEVFDFKFKTRNIPKPDIIILEGNGKTMGAWEDADGEWCKYSDVASIIAKRDELIKYIQCKKK